MKYIVLWLEGPFQSWGNESKFNVRGCGSFPSKSGILGMILAAMGKEGSQTDLLFSLSFCTQKTFVISPGSLLIDYQTAGNGYNVNDPWEKQLIPKKRNGKVSEGGGSKIIYKHYIQGGIYAVIQQIPDEISNEVVFKLQNPMWPLFLGRKNCNPSKPVFRGVFETQEIAEDEIKKIVCSDNKEVHRIILDGDYEDKGNIFVVNDVPVSFGTEKKYRSRYITVEEL